MEINTGSFGKRSGKASFKFTSANDGVLLNVHHTIHNQTDGTVVRIRFTAAGFSVNNERLIASDHRGNVFVFDLVAQRSWMMSESFGRVTAIEGLAGSKLVALGTAEGMVFVIDLDTKLCVQKLKANPGKILHLARSPEPSISNSQTNPTKADPASSVDRNDRRYLLVSSQDCAKLYLLDDFTEASSIGYGVASNNSFRPNDWHWFVGVKGSPGLISYNTRGCIRVYRINFKLWKELNAARLIELYLKNTPAQTISLARPGDEPGEGKIENAIKHLMEDAGPGPRVTTARPTADGRFYALLTDRATLAFLALDSWLVCRVVTFDNLFIAQLAFVPSARSAATARVLIARTTDNDLMLLNLGTGIRNPPSVLRPLADRTGESKCYKCAVAPNGRMLANVLKSGEVLLHNLDSYLQPKAPHPSGRGPQGVPASRSRADYYGKSDRASSSSAGSTGTVYGVRAADGTREIKLEHQLNAVQAKLSEALPKDRLLPILKEYGEYPAKYRATIWRTLLDLPGDTESFGALLQRGHHPCVAGYDRRFASLDQRTVRNLKKAVSCLAHWCPVFGLIDYIPVMVLPFSRYQPNDALGLFETVATILLNQCQLWFEFAPLEPFNYLAMVETVLAQCEPRLMAFLRKHNVPSRAYTVPLMETALAGCCATDQWLTVWDHVLSNEPCFLVFVIAAYSSVHRGAIMANDPPTKDSFAVLQMGPLDVRRLVRRAYDLMDRCPDAIHPRNYFKSFTPLNAAAGTDGVQAKAYRRAGRAGLPLDAGKGFHNAANNAIDSTSSSDSTGRSLEDCLSSEASGDGSTPTYASFRNFPKKLTEVRCTETDALRTEQHRLEAKIIELEKLEHTLQDRMVNNLIRQEHEHRVKEVERNLEEAIAREEQRVEMQRKLLLLHRKQLRERESELSLNFHNAKLINDATVRERELDTLLKKFERERRREETDLLFAEEDIKLKELEMLARYQSVPDRPTGPAKGPPAEGRPLDQRYQVALEQLAVQKLKLYDEIDRTYSSLGMPTGVNEYSYRTVSELRKVASVPDSGRYPIATKENLHQAKGHPPPSGKVTSQMKVCADTIRRMEEQVKVLQRLKNDIGKKRTSFSE